MRHFGIMGLIAVSLVLSTISCRDMQEMIYERQLELIEEQQANQEEQINSIIKQREDEIEAERIKRESSETAVMNRHTAVSVSGYKQEFLEFKKAYEILTGAPVNDKPATKGKKKKSKKPTKVTTISVEFRFAENMIRDLKLAREYTLGAPYEDLEAAADETIKTGEAFLPLLERFKKCKRGLKTARLTDKECDNAI